MVQLADGLGADVLGGAVHALHQIAALAAGEKQVEAVLSREPVGAGPCMPDPSAPGDQLRKFVPAHRAQQFDPGPGFVFSCGRHAGPRSSRRTPDQRDKGGYQRILEHGNRSHGGRAARPIGVIIAPVSWPSAGPAVLSGRRCGRSGSAHTPRRHVPASVAGRLALPVVGATPIEAAGAWAGRWPRAQPGPSSQRPLFALVFLTAGFLAAVFLLPLPGRRSGRAGRLARTRRIFFTPAAGFAPFCDVAAAAVVLSACARRTWWPLFAGGLARGLAAFWRCLGGSRRLGRFGCLGSRGAAAAAVQVAQARIELIDAVDQPLSSSRPAPRRTRAR